jgi:intein-encoded DNA endonuclease-like protein
MISLMNFSPNSKALHELKAKLVGLTHVQFEAAIGLILGDASIQSQNKGRTYRLKFEWGDINKDYAFHVHDLFKEWILSEPC